MLSHPDLSNRVIGLALEVHRNVGPGLLESVYSECLADELDQAGIPFQREITVPVVYNQRTLPLGLRADSRWRHPAESQGSRSLASGARRPDLTYLRISRIPIGLLLNFHAPRLKDGLRRFVV